MIRDTLSTTFTRAELKAGQHPPLSLDEESSLAWDLYHEGYRPEFGRLIVAGSIAVARIEFLKSDDVLGTVADPDCAFRVGPNAIKGKTGSLVVVLSRLVAKSQDMSYSVGLWLPKE